MKNWAELEANPIADMLNIIPHSKPYFGGAEIQAVAQVLRGGYLASGDKCQELETAWSELVSAEDSATVSSGLSALRLALLALDVKPGDECIIPGFSCVALLNAVMSIGAIPILADVLLDNLTLDVKSVRGKLTKRTKAIIAVHLFGVRADIEGLKQFGIPIVEDMAHAPYKLTGDAAISSFYPTKMVASLGGGIVSGEKQVIEKVKDLRSYGDKQPSTRQNEQFNDIGAAIALEGLKRLDKVSVLRFKKAQFYNGTLFNVGSGYYADVGAEGYKESELMAPPYFLNIYFYRYTIRLKHHQIPHIAKAMQERGVMVEQPVYNYLHTIKNTCTLQNTVEAFRSVLSLPLYPDITEDEQGRVVEVLGECLSE